MWRSSLTLLLLLACLIHHAACSINGGGNEDPTENSKIPSAIGVDYSK